MRAYLRPEQVLPASDLLLLLSLQMVSKVKLTIDDKGSKPGRSTCFKNDGSIDVGYVQFNRPFLIFIKDPTNDVPLFLGRVVNPKH